MRGRDPQCARREIKVSVHAQWLEDAFWAKRLERDLGLGLGQVGGQGYADVAVLALCSGSPLIKALFGVVVFSFGLEIGGERFAQRFWKVAVFHFFPFSEVYRFFLSAVQSCVFVKSSSMITLTKRQA